MCALMRFQAIKNEVLSGRNMVLCNKDCIPCCDFCLYSIHEKILIDKKVINGAPVGCFKHPDIEHQEAAENGEYCDDFHCFRAT